MAEDAKRMDQYSYAATSNLVLSSNKSRPRDATKGECFVVCLCVVVCIYDIYTLTTTIYHTLNTQQYTVMYIEINTHKHTQTHTNTHTHSQTHTQHTHNAQEKYSHCGERPQELEWEMLYDPMDL